MRPELTAADIAERVKQQLQKGRKSRFFAYYGRTADDVREKLDEGHRLIIRSPRSELELRAMLAEYDEGEDLVAFAVPFEDSVPFDLRGYFALMGRVEKIGIRDRVKTRLGLDDLDIAYAHPLLEPLLSLDLPKSTSSRRLDEEGLYRFVLQQRYKYPAGDVFELPRMMVFAATNARGEIFARELPPSAVERLGALLSQRHGPAMAVAFRAWLRGCGLDLLALCLAIQDLDVEGDANVDYWYGSRLGEIVGELPADVAEKHLARTRSALREATRTAVYLYVRDLGEDEGLIASRRAALEGRAESILRAQAALPPAMKDCLAQHTSLPAGWTARLDDFGGALIDALSRAPDTAGFKALRDAFERLREHQRPDERLERARTALRLYAYLVLRPEPDADAILGDVELAERLGKWYAREGALVDLAREQIRYSESGRFGEGLALLLQRVDARRDELDEHFARGLRAWVETGRRDTQVVPIHAAIDRIAIPFMEATDHRRLLVLLLDGMGWAAAHSLLDSLASRSRGTWAPLSFHDANEGRIGDAGIPAVFAELPTVTEISRSAFFAGRRVKPGLDHTTKDDPKRFASHPGLKKLLGAKEPKLFLRGEGHDAGGLAADEVIKAIHGDREVVGCVINAIDASLKGDTQHVTRWTLEAIRSLDAILDAAEAAGRYILFCADHGHVPGSRLRYRAGGGSAARYRPVDDGEPAGEREIVFTGDAVWRPRGAAGVALLVGERDRYTKASNAGEHGGISLAEVVTPCVLIGPEHQQETNVHTQLSRILKPRWWTLEIAEPASVEVSPPVEKKRKKSESPAQLTFDDVDPPALKSKSPPAATVGARLAKSEIFKDRIGKEDASLFVRAVDVLVAQQGYMSADEFAAAMNVFTYRVGGLVASLGEKLNIDGYPVITFDAAKNLVRLELEQLVELFGVKE